MNSLPKIILALPLAWAGHDKDPRTVVSPDLSQDVAVGALEIGAQRLLYTYFNSTALSGGLAAVGGAVLFFVIFLYFYDLAENGSNKRNDDGQTDKDVNNLGYDHYGHFDSTTRIRRSGDLGYDFNAMNILQWISMLQEVYEKFDYNDVDCQKLLICEVLRDEDSFGAVSKRLQNGFELAKYLEVLNMPDEFRELLDEYMDASERSLGQKECTEFFQCPYSLKDSVKRNFSGNSL